MGYVFSFLLGVAVTLVWQHRDAIRKFFETPADTMGK